LRIAREKNINDSKFRIPKPTLEAALLEGGEGNRNKNEESSASEEKLCDDALLAREIDRSAKKSKFSKLADVPREEE
jgi:hypothetical protein